MSMSTMRIGELAARTGVPPRMLRYYEQQGLLAPVRGENGYRAYTEADVERVTTIRGLIRSGLPTRLITVILDMDDDAGDVWTVDCTRQFASMLVDELNVLEDRITCLTRSRDTVRGYLRQTEHAALLADAAQTGGSR